jgi:hypothetical protein
LIRGQNAFDSGEELIKALDSKLKESSVADKVYYYYVKDPSLVTEQQFEQGEFENPVIIITGNDLSPTTNPFVKPIVTAFGGLSIASFAVAVCLATDMKMDLDKVESMASPLVLSVLGTQVAHEAMHQIVAYKDKVSLFVLFYKYLSSPCIILTISLASSLKLVLLLLYHPCNLVPLDASLPSSLHLQTPIHFLILPYLVHSWE